jgi:hypothetical protein
MPIDLDKLNRSIKKRKNLMDPDIALMITRNDKCEVIGAEIICLHVAYFILFNTPNIPGVKIRRFSDCTERRSTDEIGSR